MPIICLYNVTWCTLYGIYDFLIQDTSLSEHITAPYCFDIDWLEFPASTPFTYAICMLITTYVCVCCDFGFIPAPFFGNFASQILVLVRVSIEYLHTHHGKPNLCERENTTLCWLRGKFFNIREFNFYFVYLFCVVCLSYSNHFE